MVVIMEGTQGHAGTADLHPMISGSLDRRDGCLHLLKQIHVSPPSYVVFLLVFLAAAEHLSEQYFRRLLGYRLPQTGHCLDSTSVRAASRSGSFGSTALRKYLHRELEQYSFCSM
jgi:hypothetical protein